MWARSTAGAAARSCSTFREPRHRPPPASTATRSLARGIATSGSILGTWIGMVALAFFTPVLGEMALKFGAYEFFWLAVFGVVISGNLTGNDPLKGWMAGFLGLFIAGIGQE